MPRIARLLSALLSSALFVLADNPVVKFQQLEQLLPSPNAQRNAAGAPGPGYWQNRADYSIEASLDEKTHTLTGRGTITYQNASPDPLTYLWLQIDPAFFSHNADSRTLARPPQDLTKFPYRAMEEMVTAETYSSDLVIRDVKDAAGRPLAHTIVKTMMRVVDILIGFEREGGADQLLENPADRLLGIAVLQTVFMKGRVDGNHTRRAGGTIPTNPQDVDFRLTNELTEITVLEDLNADGLTGETSNDLEGLPELAFLRYGPRRRGFPPRLRHDASLHVPQP
jgi:hypothetical protein